MITEKGQYALTFGVIAALLYAVGFPLFGMIFLGMTAYFIIRLFSHTSRNETRRVFEFYLAANEILRDDERKWFAFEVLEAIALGENALKSFRSAPPLLHFTLGALYNKSGDHASAVRHFQIVFGDGSVDESTIAYPTPELRDYVRVLRKIEREPAESPLTSMSVRSLERMRKNRGTSILDESRNLLESAVTNEDVEHGRNLPVAKSIYSVEPHISEELERPNRAEKTGSTERIDQTSPKADDNAFSHRKPIIEVLHDIYDTKAH